MNRASDKEKSWVYFIEAVGQERIKIGYSKDPENRMRSLSSASPFELRLLRKVPGGRKKEQEYHDTFSEYRDKGEWFRADSEMMEYILSIPEKTEMQECIDQEPKRTSKVHRFLYCATKSKGFVSEQLYNQHYGESSIYALVVSCCQKSAVTDYFNHIGSMYYGHPGPGVDRIFHWRDFRRWVDLEKKEKSDFVDSWDKAVERMREDEVFEDYSYIWPIDDVMTCAQTVVAWSPSAPQIYNYGI